jgi:hypothetical protein
VKKSFKGLLVIMFVVSFWFCAFAEDRLLKSSDFQLEGITLGKEITEKEVFKIFGKPYEVEGPNPRQNNYNIVYYYEGLSIWIDSYKGKHTYFRFDLEGDKFKLENGIKIGEPIEKVIEKYGLGGIGKKPTDEDFMYALPVDNSKNHSDFYYSILFIRKNDRISLIRGNIFKECDCDEP